MMLFWSVWAAPGPVVATERAHPRHRWSAGAAHQCRPDRGGLSLGLPWQQGSPSVSFWRSLHRHRAAEPAGAQTDAERERPIRLSPCQDLFQDIAVIPSWRSCRCWPSHPVASSGSLPNWQAGSTVLLVVAAIAGIVLGAIPDAAGVPRHRPVHMREIFVAAAPLLVIAIAVLMESVGLPPPRLLPRRRGAGGQRIPPRAGRQT